MAEPGSDVHWEHQNMTEVTSVTEEAVLGYVHDEADEAEDIAMMTVVGGTAGRSGGNGNGSNGGMQMLLPAPVSKSIPEGLRFRNYRPRDEQLRSRMIVDPSLAVMEPDQLSAFVEAATAAGNMKPIASSIASVFANEGKKGGSQNDSLGGDDGDEEGAVVPGGELKLPVMSGDPLASFTADMELDVLKLAPKKPDWDLKRDLAPRLSVLEERTQEAIRAILKDKVESGEVDLSRA